MRWWPTGVDVAATEATVPIVVSAKRDNPLWRLLEQAPRMLPEGKAAEGKSSTKKTAKVAFFPEGGTLAAGLENRVYFSVRDGRGRPLRIRGKLVGSKGEEVTKIETSADGRGTFRFAPDAAGSYSSRITEPAGFDDSFPLPTISPEQKVAVAAVHGMLAPDQPLELAVRAAKANIRAVVAASCNGLSLGQQMLVTSAEAVKGVPVVVPLDDRAAGVVCATVYDASQCPLKAIARRLVLRQPRRLVVPPVPPSKPGGDLVLSIENEKGQAVAAALSLKVVRGGEASATGRACLPPSLLSSLLADSDVPDKSALEGLDCQSATAIDLALAARI